MEKNIFEEDYDKLSQKLKRLSKMPVDKIFEELGEKVKAVKIHGRKESK